MNSRSRHCPLAHSPPDGPAEESIPELQQKGPSNGHWHHWLFHKHGSCSDGVCFIKNHQIPCITMKNSLLSGDLCGHVMQRCRYSGWILVTRKRTTLFVVLVNRHLLPVPVAFGVGCLLRQERKREGNGDGLLSVSVSQNLLQWTAATGDLQAGTSRLIRTNNTE